MMKTKSVSLLLVLVLLAAIANAQQFTVATYNLRYDNPRDSGNLWVDRAPVVTALIRFHDFDIFGTQEGLKNQLDDIDAALPEYSHYGLGRDDGQDKGEHSAVFFKKDKFKLLDKGDFWLSETPEKPGPGWDARLNRICSWVYLQDIKSKKKFYFFNVHYDHQGVKARQESSKLILQKIKSIADDQPVLLTGDFNGDHNSGWYQEIANSGVMKDTYKEVKQPYANNASFNAFGASLQRNEIIDHVFISKQFAVSKWGVLTDSYHGKYPSDHFPVMTVVTLR
ncbi:MAG: endonuclease/exonuclease/phosphatase family protein [Chitinophagaceae bacterium]